MNVNDLTAAFMAIRAERERLATNFKREDEDLKSQQVVLEQEMLRLCSEQGADSIRTPNGTVMRGIKNRFHVLDWDVFHEFVLEHRVPQLLQKRVHESNFEEFMSGREKEGLPPGINVAREYTITVRKPSKDPAFLNVEAVA